MPAKPTVTLASRARELHAAEPGLTPTEIARRLSTPRRKVARQTVCDALSTTAKPGRPRNGNAELRVRIDAAILRRARELAESEDVDFADWIEGCLLACEQDAEIAAEVRAKLRAVSPARQGVGPVCDV